MSWFDVLKVLSPRLAMEDLKERYGLEYTKQPFSARSARAGKLEYILEGNGIKITLTQIGMKPELVGVYIDSYEEGRPTRFNQPIALSKKLENIKAHIDANHTKKAAGAVMSTSPAIHNVRYSPKKDEEEEDE